MQLDLNAEIPIVALSSMVSCILPGVELAVPTCDHNGEVVGDVPWQVEDDDGVHPNGLPNEDCVEVLLDDGDLGGHREDRDLQQASLETSASKSRYVETNKKGLQEHMESGRIQELQGKPFQAQLGTDSPLGDYL